MRDNGGKRLGRASLPDLRIHALIAFLTHFEQTLLIFRTLRNLLSSGHGPGGTFLPAPTDTGSLITPILETTPNP